MATCSGCPTTARCSSSWCPTTWARRRPSRSCPTGPSIQETGSGKGESSTYETRDTLKNKHDEDLFDYYAASQVALVDATTLAVTRVGKPGNIEAVDPAPDGQHLLVATMHKPYSYVTTHERFPREIEVWTLAQAAVDVDDDRVDPADRPRAGGRRADRAARVRLARRPTRPRWCGPRRSTAATGR